MSGMYAVLMAGAALNAATGRFVPLESGELVSVWGTWDGAFNGAKNAGLPLTADWEIVRVPGTVSAGFAGW